MKLYEFAPTRSIRARWTLQELGVDFEPIPVNLVAGQHRRPEFQQARSPCSSTATSCSPSPSRS
jgi:glutathione S-transferase